MLSSCLKKKKDNKYKSKVSRTSGGSIMFLSKCEMILLKNKKRVSY